MCLMMVHENTRNTQRGLRPQPTRANRESHKPRGNQTLFPGFLTSCPPAPSLRNGSGSCRIHGGRTRHLPLSIPTTSVPPSTRRAAPRYGQGTQEVRKPGKVPRISCHTPSHRAAMKSVCICRPLFFVFLRLRLPSTFLRIFVAFAHAAPVESLPGIAGG